jgi:beta-phosphoglucomutase family hydrolase
MVSSVHTDPEPVPGKAAVVICRGDFDAAIFDLDGVLTDTARVHAEAWKVAFDDLLQKRAERQGVELLPFDIGSDYLAYVDGRPRHDGIRTFLASRGMKLPEGSEQDPENAETVRAVGQRKTRLFREALRQGIVPAPGARGLLARLRRFGMGIAVGSSSKNCAAILRAAELDHLIDVRVDGVDLEHLGLPGKPDPALFLEAARRLGVAPARAVLLEDASAGVEAGRRGRFGRIVGIGRGRRPEELRRHGADVVIATLDQVAVVDG